MKQKMINFLLSNANPSIRLRVKKEVLMDITAAEEQKLQNEILQEKIISLIAQKQLPSGWIGLGFHGSNKNAGQYDNQEVATKYMGEKGLSGTELLNRAMDAFATTELNNHCYAGKYYSEYDTPAYGQNTIRCACISRAHYDDIIDIEPLIKLIPSLTCRARPKNAGFLTAGNAGHAAIILKLWHFLQKNGRIKKIFPCSQNRSVICCAQTALKL